MFDIQLVKEIKERGLSAVVDKYKLICKEDGKRVLLKYHQIDSLPFKANKAVREARGIILEKDTWKVLSLPFVRFFNVGEKEADSIDWNSAIIQKKEDGSLMAVYHHEGDWHVQTSGTIKADTQVGIHDITFEQLFWQVAEQYNLYKVLRSLRDTDWVFVFELCSLYNKVVETHEVPYISLLTIRDRSKLTDGKYGEIDYETVKTFGWAFNIPVVPKYEFNNIEHIQETLETLPATREGYVIVDGNFNRVKIKNPDYVKLHHAVGSMSIPNMIDIIKIGEQDEIIGHFPEYEEKMIEIEKRLNELVDKTKKIKNDLFFYFKIRDIEKDFKYVNRKAYAIYLNDKYKKYSFLFPYFFGFFDGETTTSEKEYIYSHSANKLKKTLNL